jgi:hypothetical protein
MLAVMFLLELLEARGQSRLWPFFLLFVVWANLHGGFFYGCILIGIYAVGDLLEARDADPEERPEWLAKARHHGLALGCALLASLVHPNGFTNLAHVANFFRNDAILSMTQEFMSPDFHTVNGKIFLLALFAVIATLALTRRRPTMPVLLALLANLGFALISQRNIELFALVVLPLLALTYDPEWRALPILRRAKEVFQREHVGSYSGAGAVVCSALVGAVALGGGKVAGLEIVPAEFDPKAFPVAAVREARSAALEGRMFNNFIWGGYLLHAWPEQRVFIDGGTDHYGEGIFKEYMQVWNLEPDWRQILERRQIDFALIPPTSRLAHELIVDLAWSPWYCDSTAAILRRPKSAPSSSVAAPRTRRASTCPAAGQP